MDIFFFREHCKYRIPQTKVLLKFVTNACGCEIVWFISKKKIHTVTNIILERNFQSGRDLDFDFVARNNLQSYDKSATRITYVSRIQCEKNCDNLHFKCVTTVLLSDHFNINFESCMKRTKRTTNDLKSATKVQPCVPCTTGNV